MLSPTWFTRCPQQLGSSTSSGQASVQVGQCEEDECNEEEGLSREHLRDAHSGLAWPRDLCRSGMPRELASVMHI